MQNRRDLRARLRLFKVQCSKVQRKLPLCCVETEPLRQTESPFQPFQTFHRFAPFITGISPFQAFQSFNRFAPFKTFREFLKLRNVQITQVGGRNAIEPLTLRNT